MKDMIDKELWNVFYHLNPNSAPWDNPNGDPDQHVVDFLNYANLNVSDKVLDVGCGYGKNAAYMIKEGLNVTGVDVARFAVDKCKDKFPEHAFIPMDVLENNFSDKSFDTVIDAGALHVNDPENHKDFFKQYHRLLKDDAVCFIRIFNRKETSDKPIFFVYLRMPVYGRTEQEVRDLVQDLFEVEKVIYNEDYGMHGEGCNFYYLRKK